MPEHKSHRNRTAVKNPRTKTTGGRAHTSESRSVTPEGRTHTTKAGVRSVGDENFSPGDMTRASGGRKPSSGRKNHAAGDRRKKYNDRFQPSESGRPARSGQYGGRKSKGRLAVPGNFKSTQEIPEKIRLNKYIAHAGICSRRDADEFISAGNVTVNGKKCTELGVLVSPDDRVAVNGQTIEPEPFVYFLMNKPKDTITTTNDERGRKTVMDLIEHATGLRVYPVGRLDRNTTGLILLTNDGDLANRLMHPSYKVRKVYDVETNRHITDEELRQLRTGIPLDDGPAKAYRASRNPEQPNTITLSMHEGRNRVVRRMFEVIGAEVVKLDRVTYGPLQKKGLRIGRWRKLRNHEINELRKMVRLLPMEHRDRR